MIMRPQEQFIFVRLIIVCHGMIPIKECLEERQGHCDLTDWNVLE